MKHKNVISIINGNGKDNNTILNTNVSSFSPLDARRQIQARMTTVLRKTHLVECHRAEA